MLTRECPSTSRIYQQKAKRDLKVAQPATAAHAQRCMHQRRDTGLAAVVAVRVVAAVVIVVVVAVVAFVVARPRRQIDPRREAFGPCGRCVDIKATPESYKADCRRWMCTS